MFASGKLDVSQEMSFEIVYRDTKSTMFDCRECAVISMGSASAEGVDWV